MRTGNLKIRPIIAIDKSPWQSRYRFLCLNKFRIMFEDEVFEFIKGQLVATQDPRWEATLAKGVEKGIVQRIEN